MFRRRTTSDAPPELARALLVAEYQRLSTEVYHSYETAQGIVRFSLAAYGAIFAAGLLAARGAIEGGLVDGFDPSAVMIVFGLVLPALMCVGCWTWIGELNRAERAGLYVYSIERRLAADPALMSAIRGLPPLNWETHLRRSTSTKGSSRKTIMPYLGTAVLFAGGALTSFILAMLWWVEVWDWPDHTLGEAAWIVGPAALQAIFLGTSALMGRRLLALGRSGPVLPD